MDKFHKETVLLVEDQLVTAVLEKKILQRNNYRVIIADSGEVAVKIVETTPGIDLILMDIDLGVGIDGTEAAEIILKKFDLPLIFLSSHTEPEIVKKTEGITSYGYIVKNSGETVLIASIKMAFRLHEAHLRERELVEKLSLQALVLDQIQDNVTVTDLEGNITYVNEAECKTLEREKEDLISSSVHSFGEDSLKGAKQTEIIQKTLKNGYWKGEVVNFSSDGREILFQARTQVIHDRNGNPIALCGISTDITEKKRFEKKLKEASIRINALLANSPNLIMVFDEHGKFLEVSDAFARSVGLNRETVAGQSFYELLPENIVAQLNEAIKLLKETGKPLNRIFKLDINNDERFLETRLFSLKHSELKLELFGAIATDITERMKDEEKLNKVVDEQNLILDNIDAQVWYLISPQRYGIVNRSYADFFGKQKELFYNQNILSVRDDKDMAEACILNSKKVFEEKEVLKTEEWLRSSTGELRCFSVLKKPKIDEKGKVDYVVCTSIDITDRITAEKKLAESEEKYRMLAENSTDVIWLTDIELNLKYVSPSIEKVIGFSQSEYCNRKIESNYTPESYKKIMLILQEELSREDDPRFKKDRNRVIEAEHYTSEGETVLLELNVSFLRDEKGNPVGLQGVTRDLTERKKAENQLQTAISIFDALLANSPNPMIFFDSKGKFVNVSDSYADALGAKKENLTGKRFSDVLPEEQSAGLCEIVNSLKKEKKTLRKTEELTIGDQTRKYELVFFPVKEDHEVGELYCLMINLK